MMAFQNGFVVSVVKDKKVFRESAEDGNRTVRLPFNSEYSLRIQNKNRVRAYAKVTIDGTDVHNGKILLSPNSSIDLERFVLDGDLNKGRKLKFVSAGHSDVQDPTSKDNGIIEVVFEKEVEHIFTTSGMGTANIKLGGTGTLTSNSLGGILRGCSAKNIGSAGVEGSTFQLDSSNYSMDLCRETSDRGATVEGGNSNQQFSECNDWFQTCLPVSIKIQLRGLKEKKTWSFRNVPEGFIVAHNDTRLSLVEEVSINATHLVIKIPISQVSIGQS